MNIQIQVRKKQAINITPENVIVCGNSGYAVEFIFDEEWKSTSVKTARFVYRKDGKNYYDEVVFTGITVKVPVLKNINYVLVGVYEGDLQTTTPAVVECEKSILCGGGVHEDPTPDVYNQIIEFIESGRLQKDARLPDAGSEDNGKILQARNGVYTLVSVKDSSVATFIDDYISEALGGDY